MPITKQKHIRHYALDRCFRNRAKRYYIEDLLEACNKALATKDCAPISKRTLQYDLNEFEDLYRTPDKNSAVEHIVDSHGRTYYRYEDPNFSIQNAPITEEELSKLKETVLMLNRFKGLPQFDWMTELLTKIETKLHVNEQNSNVISFDNNEYLQGLDYIGPLFDYIVNKQTIELQYQPYGKSILTQIVSPYHIKQYNNRWFLLAGNESRKLIHFALDRIVDIQPTHAAFIPTDIDFVEYFDDVIGVTIPKDAAPKQILLRFTANRLPYVLSKPLHPSQKIKDKGQGLIEITVIPNQELEALLLWYGNDVEVLQPTELRQRIAEKITKMHDLYL